MPFLDSLDIANRALQHCGAPQIEAVDEDSKRNLEVSFVYDKVRRAELRRNVWRFSIRKAVIRPIDTTTLLLSAPPYDATKIYSPAAIVRDTNGQLWRSLIADNLGNDPGGNNEAWDSYFGPRTVVLWSASTTYFIGELVYLPGSTAGSYQVYISLANANAAAPNVATPWVSTTTYSADQSVSYSGSQWRNLLPVNTGITPADGAGAWNVVTTYSTGNQATGPSGRVYTSATDANIGNDPATDDGTNWTAADAYTGWSRTPTVPVSATSWLPLGDAALKPLTILYPANTGPSSQASSLNVFYLPAGFLRLAPQDPKAGSNSYLGAPSGLIYNDWNLEGDCLVSGEVQPIILRFAADVTVVSKMDDMFCEGLACRIATEVCESLTQSAAKLQTIASAYKLFMGEARTVNAIETGSVEPPLDDYISCRS